MKLQNLIHILIGIVCVGLLPGAKAVAPPPDGDNTAEAQNALLSLTTGVPLTPSGDVQQAWVARYYEGDYNEATAIAVDGSGNVYVTGNSYDSDGIWDYATIKYNSAGRQQWVARYNGPANGNDYASAIAVDGTGNVYVTGSIYGGSLHSRDYATIKYNSAGQEQWVARYEGHYNEATAIAVDGSGNVYVTGYSYDSNGISDYATIKYNSAGRQQWVARYNGPANKSVSAEAIAVDGLGNAYVTGTIGDDEGYATVKYNSAGQQQWVARYHNTLFGSDSVSGIALDSSGNVYVTGSSDDSDWISDYATIKYNSAGQQQWVARYNGPVNGDDYASAIAVDGTGNVYVTGSSNDIDALFDYATIKYNSAGQQQWVARYNGPSNGNASASAIALDSSGNVYVTGSYYATIKYNSAGQQQWVARDNAVNGFATAIAVDASGYVFVTGSGSNADTEYATIKYLQEVVATNAASNITSASARLNGAVNPNGLTTTVHFEYGLTTNYGSTTATASRTGNTTQSVSANITGLSPNTTYHFRLVATNNHGTKYGGDRTFSTFSPTGPPVVATSAATNVASFSATLDGTVYPHGLTTSVYFQYGTGYGLTTVPQTTTGNTYRSLSANISGLSAHTTYHFRIVATNSAGTRYGSDRTLTTQ